MIPTGDFAPRGDPPRHKPQSVLRTFLFSDIEGSTVLWERAPDAMASALEQHDRMLRETFEAAGGAVFSHRGDGLAVAFAAATDAVRAAVAALRANRRLVWNELGSVRIRIGIHAGEAVYRDDNYFGPPLNLTSRLTAAAHGDQVLVSDVVRRLVGDRLDDEIWLEDLGTWYFDGIAGAERVHDVRHPELEENPRVLRAGRRAGASLPTMLGRFIGRSTEQRRITEAFGTTRIVTLCGTGGAGKTRLAVDFAKGVGEPFGAGARFVDLTRAHDSKGVLVQLADAFGVRLIQGAESIDTVTRSIGDAPVLVVLDNCEHLVDSVAEHVVGLLGRCPEVGVLATSREPLHVRGERIIEVLPMATGSLDAPGDAVELLVDRAHAANAVVRDADPALHELARAVDGLPLALELMAPRLAHMKPNELVEQLAEVGTLVSIDGPRERGRSELRTAFAWSYGRLDPSVQVLFAAMSVCVGGTTIEGAAHLLAAAGLADVDARSTLGALVDESLIVADTSGTVSRYRMLQPVREFAAECLADLGIAHELEEVFVAHLAAVAEREGAGLHGPSEADSVDRINAEFDNLRAGARWCAEHDRADLGFRIVAPLVDHVQARGKFEVGAWALALTQTRSAPKDPLYPTGLAIAAQTALNSGQLVEADELSAAALAAELEEGARPSWLAHSVRVLLIAAGQVTGDLKAEFRVLREVADGSGDPFGQAVYHFNRALIMKFGHNPDRLAGPATALLSLGAGGSPSIRAMGLMIQGWLLAAQSRPAEAADALRESASLAASTRNTTIGEMAHRDMLDVDKASLEAYGATLQQFLGHRDVEQGVITVIGMLPSLLELRAYEAAAITCGWLMSTPWARSAQLSEAMRRLDEHLDPATAAAARARGEAMELQQLIAVLQTTARGLVDPNPGDREPGSG